LRVARLTDAAAIRQIYSYYVQNTAITCEVTVPTVEEITGRVIFNCFGAFISVQNVDIKAFLFLQKH
jgi:L-amino acid N-acyltransferase YncA